MVENADLHLRAFVSGAPVHGTYHLVEGIAGSWNVRLAAAGVRAPFSPRVGDVVLLLVVQRFPLLVPAAHRCLVELLRPPQ